MLMVLSLHGAIKLGPEQDPEPPQELGPAPNVAPAV